MALGLSSGERWRGCLSASTALCKPRKVKNLCCALGKGQGQKTTGEERKGFGGGEWVKKMLRKKWLGWETKWFSEQDEEGGGCSQGPRSPEWVMCAL